MTRREKGRMKERKQEGGPEIGARHERENVLPRDHSVFEPRMHRNRQKFGEEAGVRERVSQRLKLLKRIDVDSDLG